MATDIAQKFYTSRKWQSCRKSFIAERRSIDGGLCQRCHDRVGYIVHHKIYLDASNIQNPEITLNFDNLEFVCKYCHDLEHFIPKRKELLCGFDANGKPIQKEGTQHANA